MRHQSKARADGSRYGYYLCDAPQCRGVGVGAEGVEGLVGEVIVARLGLPDAAAALGPDTDPAADARALLAAAAGKFEELADAYDTGRIGLEAFAAADRRLRERLAAARAAVAEASAPVLPAWAAGAPDPAAAWESWDAPARHIVAGALFERIEVRPSGRTGRPKKGVRPVDPARLGFLRRGTTEIVWGRS
jgi:hypothetical protein